MNKEFTIFTVLLVLWVLCLIFQSYDLILIDQATGTSYTGSNSLFPARRMREQAFSFYTDCINIVRAKDIYGYPDTG